MKKKKKKKKKRAKEKEKNEHEHGKGIGPALGHIGVNEKSNSLQRNQIIIINQ